VGYVFGRKVCMFDTLVFALLAVPGFRFHIVILLLEIATSAWEGVLR
jgi:hypothetical protein